MRLLAVELTRFRSRRAIALLGAGARRRCAVVLVGVTAWNTRPLTQADRADAARPGRARGPDARDPAAGPRLPRGRRRTTSARRATADDCADALVPGPEAYYPRDAAEPARTRCRPTGSACRSR